jgi:citrate lyase subunit beta/citryl-CoA lyase
VERATEICAHPRVVATYFGAEDYTADIGGRRTPSNHEVHFARSQVAIAGRLGGVPVIDQAVTNISDLARFRREAEEAVDMGFRGKICVHPDQVPIANEVFTPSPQAVERARRLIETYERAAAAGSAVAHYEGEMVNAPLVSMAAQILALAGE